MFSVHANTSDPAGLKRSHPPTRSIATIPPVTCRSSTGFLGGLVGFFGAFLAGFFAFFAGFLRLFFVLWVFLGHVHVHAATLHQPATTTTIYYYYYYYYYYYVLP